MAEFTITSPHNPRIREAARLRDRRQRQSQRRFLIDGLREIGAALAAGVRLHEVYVCDEFCDESCASLLGTVGKEPDVIHTGPAAYARLAYGERAQGIVVVAEAREHRLDQLALPAERAPLVAVLVGVEKPGNVGAVARSADAAGVAALILADCPVDIYNPNCIRASLGTIFQLPVAVAPSHSVLNWLHSNEVHITAAVVGGQIPYTSVNFKQRTAVALGSEAAGLPDMWQGGDVTSIRLPLLGRADSLNVSVTASVIFYEALRQKSLDNPPSCAPAGLIPS
jgi:TrmH family RNA methyltransferase